MKRPITYKGKEITTNDFTPCIPWDQLDPIMGKKNSKAFLKWLNGQTCLEAGFYECDLKAWLSHGINFD